MKGSVSPKALMMLALLLTVASVNISCSAAQEIPQQPILKVGVVPVMDCAQAFVADEKGYFAETGLRVELVKMAGGAVIAPAVEGGDLTIGWSNLVSIAAARSQGYDFVFLTAGATSNTDDPESEVGSMMLPPGSEVQRPSDLKGKRIGVNTVGNISELIVRIWAERTGLGGNNFQLVEVPYPQMEDTLSSGKLDAALVWEPYVTRALANKSGRILDANPVRAIGDRVPIASWFAKSSWVKNNPTDSDKFVKAIEKASAFILSNPHDARSIIARSTALEETLVQESKLPLFPAKWDRQDVQQVVDQAQHYGLVNKPVEAGQLFLVKLNP